MRSSKALVNMTTKIAEIIKAHQSFEIITHKSPDEDAVGASRAVGLALVTLGKSVCLVYPTPVPTILDFTDKPLEQDLLAVEITFLVDVSDMAMLANTKPRGKVVVIDHHRTTNNIGYASWIDSEKSPLPSQRTSIWASSAIQGVSCMQTRMRGYFRLPTS
jgi:nanoRNase/pAp phosphatase (c-di-AMP/oligoRNAs hydrolase)